MLTAVNFPLVPRLQYLESQLPRIGTLQTRNAIIAALLSEPYDTQKCIDTIADLTQYATARLEKSLPHMLADTSFVKAVLINNRRAFSIDPINSGGRFHGAHVETEEKIADTVILNEVLRGVLRRRNANLRTAQRPNDELQPQPHVHSPRHPPQSSANFTDQKQPVHHNESIDANAATGSHSVGFDQAARQTQEVTKRFAEIAGRYHVAISTKCQIEQLGPAGDELNALKRELLSDAHDTLQNMMQETGQVMADSLDATMCTVISPCGVCFDTMRNPHVFTRCGHAFCQSCCDRIQWAQINPLSMGKECPMCRQMSAPIHLFL